MQHPRPKYDFSISQGSVATL